MGSRPFLWGLVVQGARLRGTQWQTWRAIQQDAAKAVSSLLVRDKRVLCFNYKYFHTNMASAGWNEFYVVSKIATNAGGEKGKAFRQSTAQSGRLRCVCFRIGKFCSQRYRLLARSDERFKEPHAFPCRKSREALEWLAVNPHIKVIHNTRNLLDVAVSRYKHNLHGGKLSSHCEDEACAAKVTASDLVMPVDNLIGSLTTLDHGRAYVSRQLDAFQVPRVDVKYEKLYYAPTAEEWMRLFDFVGVGPTENLTMADVEKHMRFVVTHPPVRNQTLGNYKEIHDALKGTEWEKLLKPVWEEALL